MSERAKAEAAEASVERQAADLLRPRVTRVSEGEVSCCVPRGWSDLQVAEFVRTDHPLSRERARGWACRAERTDCPVRPGMAHVTLAPVEGG
jgi:hypothetical protein